MVTRISFYQRDLESLPCPDELQSSSSDEECAIENLSNEQILLPDQLREIKMPDDLSSLSESDPPTNQKAKPFHSKVVWSKLKCSKNENMLF